MTGTHEALTSPEVRRRMDEFGLSWDVTDLAACEADVRAERERWTEYTRVAGIQPELYETLGRRGPRAGDV